VRELFHRFDSTRVVVIGDLMLDVYLYGRIDRISPEAPVPVLNAGGESIMLGGAANVAGNIRALGGHPVLVGVVGNDESADKLRSVLKELGLDDRGLIVDESRPTTRKTRVIADRQQVIRVDREENRDIDRKIANRILSFVEEAMESADAMLLQDYNKGTLTPDIIGPVIQLATERGKIINVDPKFHNFFEFKRATLFKPNIREMEVAFGSVHADDRGLEKMMIELRNRVESRHVLLTCGKDGMVLLDESGKFHRIPAVSREVYDVSGAGDTVISTVTLALASGGDALESSVLANYAAGVEIQRSGVRTVSQDEIIEAIQGYGGRNDP
jgi:D-beta-D-heptose 7-phosphate kinase/D-beta-D-heptose 1-phosphate adenosyltransferase